MGHISLVVPVAHIWYFRSLPNKIGYLLGLPTKKLDSIIYYERYVVINAGVAQSDDVIGRAKAYEAIVKGEPMPTPGIPGSLNVLLHELRGLGLSVNLV
jgi:DNA-directed RNA polymerase subunit beta'